MNRPADNRQGSPAAASREEVADAETEVVRRARRSLGTSSEPIYRTVADCLAERRVRGSLLDVGCGRGRLWDFVCDDFGQYTGADVVNYEGFPATGRFVPVDLDSGRVPLPDGCADAVVAVETIEHLENPRAFVRELVRLCRPGGWVAVTTPNQLSFLSKLTLVLKNQFNAFTNSNYPAHLTALLECDLRRILAECGLSEVSVRYTGRGRVPGTGRHYPAWLGRRWPRLCSDNVVAVARRPAR